MKTMSLRVERQCTNALAIATWLAGHPAIAQVHYPRLPKHPDYAVAQRTLGGKYGAMLAFELRQPEKLTLFADALELVLPASTLGDIYTMISVPAQHRIADYHRPNVSRGISDGLIRMSVGIEAIEDIQADLAHALEILV
jgi:cystathionine gamma-synthase/methionine-gamma-lyase